MNEENIVGVTQPADLQTIVKNMIANGESTENIQKVIRQYNSLNVGVSSDLAPEQDPSDKGAEGGSNLSAPTGEEKKEMEEDTSSVYKKGKRDPQTGFYEVEIGDAYKDISEEARDLVFELEVEEKTKEYGGETQVSATPPSITTDDLLTDDTSISGELTERFLQWGFTFDSQSFDGEDVVTVTAHNGQKYTFNVQDGNEANTKEKLQAFINKNAHDYGSQLDASIALTTLSKEEQEDIVKGAGDDIKSHREVNETRKKDEEFVRNWIASNPDINEPPMMWNEGLKYEFNVQKGNAARNVDSDVGEAVADPRVTAGWATTNSNIETIVSNMAREELMRRKVSRGELEEDQVENYVLKTSDWEEMDEIKASIDRDDPAIASMSRQMTIDTNMLSNIASNVEKQAEDMDIGVFTSSELQNDLYEQANDRVADMSEELTAITNKSQVVGQELKTLDESLRSQYDWFKNNDPTERIAEIDAQPQTAELIIERNGLIREYTSRVNAYNQGLKTREKLVTLAQGYIQEAEQLAIDEKELRTYVKAMGKNYSQGAMMGNAIQYGVIELVQGFERGLYLVNPYGFTLDLIVNSFEGESRDVANTVATTLRIFSPGGQMYIRPDADDRNSAEWLLQDGLDGYQEYMKDEVVGTLVAWDDIETSDQGLEWLAGSIAQNLPQIGVALTTGGYGMAILGTSAGGGHYKEMQESKDLYMNSMGLYGNNYSYTNMYLSSVGVGLIEGITEKWTANLVAGTGNLFTKGAKQGLNQTFGRRLLRGGLNYQLESFGEGGSEVLATIGGNSISILSGDKSVGLFDDVAPSFITGYSLGNIIQTPSLVSSAISPFASEKQTTTLDANFQKIEDLKQEFSTLDPNNPEHVERANKIKRDIADAVSQNADAIAEDVKRVDVMTNPDKQTLVNIESDNRKLNVARSEIALDQSLDADQKKQQIEAIDKKIKSNNKTKQDIINSYPESVVNENYKKEYDKIQDLARQAEEAGSPEIRVRSGLDADMAGFMQEMQDEGAIDALAASEGEALPYGAMVPVLGKDGKVERFEMFINREAVNQDEQFGTQAHEFMHTVLYNTLKQDPITRERLGKEVDKIIKGPGVTISNKAQQDLNRLEQYEAVEKGEELIAIVSENMATGDIKIDDTRVGKFKDSIRRLSQNVTGKDIAFDTNNDVRNFLKDYHKSMRKGKLDPRLARMLSTGANGRILDPNKSLSKSEIKKRAIKNAKDKANTNFSKAVDANLSSNPDMKSTFDKLVQNPDGTRKFENNEEFKLSPEFLDGYTAITDSNVLDRLIQQGMTDLGLPPGALKDFTQQVKEKLGDRYLKNFDVAKNDSLFGWLTGKSGGRGESIIYRAKGDVMNDYKKAGEAETSSLDAEIADGMVVGDVVQADIDSSIEAFEEMDLSRTEEQRRADEPKKIIEELGVNQDLVQDIVDTLFPINEETGQRENASGVTMDQFGDYKSLKPMLTGAQTETRLDKDGNVIVNKKTGEPKQFKVKSVKKVVPTGPYYKVLEIVARDVYGVDPKKMLTESDLSAGERKAIQSVIDKNAQAHKDIVIPEGDTASVTSTGAANTSFGVYYVGGGRGQFAAGATAAGKATQAKRDDITNEEILRDIGKQPDGTYITNDRSFDPMLRTHVIMSTVLATNQMIRENNLLLDLIPSEVAAKLADGKALPAFNKRPISERQIQADYIRKVNTAEGQAIKELHPELTEEAEDYAISSLLQINAGGYNSQVFNDPNTSSEFKKFFVERGKTKQVVYNGPKLYDIAGNGQGKLNKTGEKYIDQVTNIASTFHSAVPIDMLLPMFGVKDSGSKQFEGETTYSTRSINPKAAPDKINKVKNRKPDNAAEEKLMRDNGINPDDIKFARPIVMKGRIAEIFAEIENETTKEAKLQKLEELKPELDNISRGNEALLKYMVLKMDQAHQQGKIDEVTQYHLGSMQTNIVEGIRGLSTYEYQYLTDGKQYPIVPKRGGKYQILKRPGTKGRFKKDYLESPEWAEYNSQWEDVQDYQEVYNDVLQIPQVTKLAEKEGVAVELIAQDLTTKMLMPKNEHVGASATTNAEINVYVNSSGRNMKLDDIGSHHKSFFGPKFLMDKHLDAKVEINGMLVDNKVSFEGALRLTKFAGKRRNDIYHRGGQDVAEYVIENKDAIEEARNKYIPEIQERVDAIRPAVSLSKRTTGPDKGASIWDFDDTLARTKSDVLFTRPDGSEGRLTAEEFASKGSTLLAEGYKFDFSEFDKVTGGKPGPFFDKAMERAKKFGTKDTFILTARNQVAAPAIKEFLDALGLDIPLKNITGLGNSTGKAKADWIVENIVNKGYNNIGFADDAMQNVIAVKETLDQFDVKSDVQQAKASFSRRAPQQMDAILNEGAADLDSDFNVILEQTKGVASQKQFSAAKARKRGQGKGRFKFFIPPSADDFAGLMYSFMGKGEQGNKHHAFFKKNLFDPFSKGIRMMNRVKQSAANDLKTLRKQMPEVRRSLGNKVANTDFTVEDAIRVYNWNKAGFDVPGLSRSDLSTLVRHVSSNASLRAFADGVNTINQMPDAVVPPDNNWLGGNIALDLKEAMDASRTTYLREWVENKDIIFNEANMNKIEAVYGPNFREALEDSLYRMENGGNRSSGSNRQMNAFMSWINGSIGTTMFFNARSAMLQMISNVNFVNWSDNNMLAAAKAFANQPQYWSDVAMIFNSPFLKQRRGGLATDVNAAELLEQIKDSRNPSKAAIAHLLQLGFAPTQIADSFAIATGGATMYRNRVNTYLKDGLNQADAETKAFEDMMEIAEETQQSSREDRISQQQASPLGKLILAFQNTPMQYNRLIKKAALDLINGRGDAKANVSRIVYYGAIQNMIFYGLQQALFAALFGDDEEDEITDDKLDRVLNGMVDTLLRGSGIAGAVVSTAKNVILRFMEEEKKQDDGLFYTEPDHAYTLIEALNLSPPIGIKARKLYSAAQTWEFNDDVIDYMDKTDIDNPMWEAVANVTEAVTNIPLHRLYSKYQNISEAMNSDHATWKRVAMFLGWSKWNFGIKNSDVMSAKNELKEIKEEEKEERREQKKKEKEEEKKREQESQVEENIEKQKEDREAGKETTCAAISGSGKRCKNKPVGGGAYCTIHEEVEQGDTQVQCSHIKKNGKRCKMKTKNKSGLCYYHD